MDVPAIVINVKTYKEGTGKNVVELAKSVDKIRKKASVEIALAVQPVDIYRVCHATDLLVFAQHIDAIGYGSNTGWILPEAVKEAGAIGTLLNHSEHLLPLKHIAKAIQRATSVQMETIVCAADVKIAQSVARFSPDFVAVEPPELIGGDISVTTAKPEVVRSAVKAVNKIDPNVKVLCGAGVKTGEDARMALELGADGILLASGVVKSKEKELIVDELARAVERV